MYGCKIDPDRFEKTLRFATMRQKISVPQRDNPVLDKFVVAILNRFLSTGHYTIMFDDFLHELLLKPRLKKRHLQLVSTQFERP